MAACLAAAACALCLTGGGERALEAVSSPEDLRGLLREAQWGLLPLGSPVLHDAGDALFLAEDAEGDAFLLALLLSAEDWLDGLDVTVSEDAATRETLFRGPGGEVFWSLPPEEGYDPAWTGRLLHPEQVPERDGLGPFDPSLAGLRVTLWPLAVPDIPDDRGVLMEGERPREPQEDGMEGERPREPQEDPEDDDELPPPPPPSRTNALDVAGGTLLPAAPAVGATIYVDAARGDDAWTGRSAQPRGGGEGPKRTLAAGLSAAGRGGRLVIAAGDYTEKLDVRGTGVRVTVTGNASFGTAAERRVSKGARAPAAPLAIPPAAAPTGTVVNAFN